MITVFWILIILATIGILAYNRASLLVYTVAGFVLLLVLSVLSNFYSLVLVLLWLIYLAFAILLNPKQLRTELLTKRLFKIYKKIKPSISKTEAEAIEAGTVQWAGELFSGCPNWKGMLDKRSATLTQEEQEFLDGPTEELCKMIDDWDMTHNQADIPPQMWKFIKDNGFFAMIIPKKYGGKGFSATLHSAVVTRIGAFSITVGSTVAVPNSLGPAELIHKYGTDEQKNYYLPRLATGKEIPCFALTNPEAGSDASNLPDSGIVCKGKYEGKEIIGIKLNFNKRYITLAPVATVIGLAFQMYDPDGLLGDEKALGITCALIPRNIKGIEIGRRHFPLNMVFQNGPIKGKDIFIPLDYIIGGVKMAGKGWRMLVECLSVGRGISLPGMATGAAKAASLATGAYARIRRQFGLPIGYFEGVEEALTRIAGLTYIIDATRSMTIAAIDRGEKPSVLTAITKYHTTTMAREIAADTMDIHAGKGICLGPRNYLGRAYEGIPISITVEGANILTRSMIIFGQGALRCHPYVLAELHAANNTDSEAALTSFDKAIMGHIGFIISNVFRSFILALTSSQVVLVPQGKARRYLQHFTRFSSAFALLTDMAMVIIGGDLKRKEKLSARLGDVLSLLYMGSAVVKRFYEQGKNKEDLPLFDWSCQHLLVKIQDSIDAILTNFPNRVVAKILRFIIFPLGRRFKLPSDRLGHQVAAILLDPNPARERLIAGLCRSKEAINPIGRLDEMMQLVIAAEPIEKKVRKAQKDALITGYNFSELIKAATKEKIITQKEAEQLLVAYKAQLEVIAVDDFDNSELVRIPK